MKNLQLFKAVGLMSGTSMDGIDVAWIETDGVAHIRLLGSFSVAHEASFYEEMKAIESAMKEIVKNKDFLMLPSIQQLTQKIDVLHARAILGLCKKYQLKAQDIDIVGYHGQTVYHKPSQRITVQIGNPQHLANYVKMPVMGNVRQNDIQQGGQGAPVAPIYHQALVLRDNLGPSAVINCGGISNITGISGEAPSDILGFDAGPGNGLLDRWVKEKTQGKEFMDRDGKYALTGKIHTNILKELYEQSCLYEGVNYYNKKPPKSLDIRDFHWTSSFSALSLEDGCATLAAFTALCIAQALSFIPITIKNVILIGGGWQHPLILQRLKEQVEQSYTGKVRVVRGDEIGWSSQYLEAELMAFLAVRSHKKLPITFPLTTGVPCPLIGGEIFYPEKISDNSRLF